jgi:protein involved in polysaccharide export with SLBB domain
MPMSNRTESTSRPPLARISVLFSVGIAAFSLSGIALPARAQNPPAPQGNTVVDPFAGPIRKNDILAVQIAGEPSLSGQYRVSSEGTITLPLVGDVTVVALMPNAVASTIAGLYKKKEILQDPQVVVIIISRTQRTVFIRGAVEKQGSIVINEKTYLDEMHKMQISAK